MCAVRSALNLISPGNCEVASSAAGAARAAYAGRGHLLGGERDQAFVLFQRRLQRLGLAGPARLGFDLEVVRLRDVLGADQRAVGRFKAQFLLGAIRAQQADSGLDLARRDRLGAGVGPQAQARGTAGFADQQLDAVAAGAGQTPPCGPFSVGAWSAWPALAGFSSAAALVAANRLAAVSRAAARRARNWPGETQDLHGHGVVGVSVRGCDRCWPRPGGRWSGRPGSPVRPASGCVGRPAPADSRPCRPRSP